MCHRGRVNRPRLIGSPYSALGPISASEMMYTSLDAGRQWRPSPFIQASRAPSQSHTLLSSAGVAVAASVRSTHANRHAGPARVLPFIAHLVRTLLEVYAHARGGKSIHILS